ncbi:phospho-sugar mutase [Arthrobacter cryoconiti]|uniref:Phospho-sugar mutase n=1 Tax=Arthrobacter cryoconiti TaxID=748907 RepID=A0ABV8R488_9MICC|nr:phospho-sugar mutase [Arthrobacter cryoconiti]MCC9067050.1 phospho-sugar mutase [Arthrobacter cryoconiti]
MSAGIANAATQWAQNDPDPATAAQLQDLLRLSATDSAAAAELADSFAGNLQFGTAGLRAAMGPGPNRMNRTVVRRAAAGVAAHLLRLAVTAEDGNGPRSSGEAGRPDLSEGLADSEGSGRSHQEPAAAQYTPRAVVGFDARHNSENFATETAAIFTAAGIETFLLPSPLPTPVLAYAVRALGCEAGVMVTASHNPAKDNGYKVYLGNRAVAPQARGVQIVAPHDAGIAAHIAGVSATAQAGDTSNIPMASSGWSVPDDSLLQGYISAVSALVDVDSFPERELRIVHTSMHGVGNDTALAVLNKAGFTDVHTVAKQAAPDPDFPTVPFPNPEEPGALDLAFELAHEVGADIVLANDPDADRAAVGAVDPATGKWHKFHGDEVGALLGAHLARRGGRAERVEGAMGSTVPVFANSIVSSRLLARIAAGAGYRHQETLTGFKWISRVPGLTFGYEEALGYCVAPEVVRDKDGMSAGLLIAEMAAALKAEGRTLFDVLDELALAHGLHASGQISIRVNDLDDLKRMMSKLRDQPPVAFAGSAVVLSTDLSLGTPQLPATDGLLYITHDDSRVIVRPSGTEPKLKCYLEVIVPVSEKGRINEARSDASRALSAVGADIKAALGV